VPFVTQQKPPPESLATTIYFGVNAFAFVDNSGKKIIVRYRFVPEAGEKYLDATTAASKGPNYLMEEIAEREDRQLVKLGTLTITGMAADQEHLSRSLLFLSNNIPDGIEAVDPMIEVRGAAYPISFGERQ
jgi:catalase